MSELYQTANPFASDAFEALKKFATGALQSPLDGPGGFEGFERELHEHIMDFEAEVVGKQLQRYDLDVKEIEVQGERFRRKDQFEKEYHGLAGNFAVNRTLYVPCTGRGRAIVPLDLRAGIVEETWTPLLARVMGRTVASSTPKEAAEVFKEFGGATPSPSSLDRLPKRLSEIWERQREPFEEEIRCQETVPSEATSVGVSLDGVMIPMKAGPQHEGEKQDSSAEEDKKATGPTDYKEASCGTVSFYDADGERIETVRYGRQPEHKKKTLKSQLTAELESIFKARPDLTLVGLSDGAPDHWEFLSQLPEHLGVEKCREVVDIFHVLERLKEALDTYHGEGNTDARAAFEQFRIWLREEEDGAERVLRALRYRRDKCRGKKRKTIRKQIKYIEKQNRAGRLLYKQFLDEKLPIGSGIVEAACKTLASQRLKCSGMSWSQQGAQAILTIRSLIQSERWNHAWKALSDQYHAEVTVSQPGKKQAA